ncbi:MULTISPECIES: hypothetical protein [unclassified Bradyrhizobium]|uniref:hypothetical protein n=1 Tax=unclassified Bradyrhizobium TaxID=2631580 RepID=UPI001FF8DEAE|nr:MULTISPECIES: hypothetical protein [unclassified Bradyrhizobium]MCK1344508.1 hypothetical protein [Bradyrhizobium sp. CW11]MCK1591090.1 hypothetical protein [Bradyrhizobium sp. 169]
MDGDGISPEIQQLLQRADRAIGESVRLREVNAEVRRELRLTRYEMERQLAHSRLSLVGGLFGAVSTRNRQ